MLPCVPLPGSPPCQPSTVGRREGSWPWQCPFLKAKVQVTQSCPTLRDPMDCSPWKSPAQNTGVGSLSLLQRIFPTQGPNPGLPHCRWILYQPSHQGSSIPELWPVLPLHPCLASTWRHSGCLPGASPALVRKWLSVTHLQPHSFLSPPVSPSRLVVLRLLNGGAEASAGHWALLGAHTLFLIDPSLQALLSFSSK